MNKYKVFYKDNSDTVEANTTLEARDIYAKEHNINKVWDITPMLIEKDGQEIVHKPMF